VFAASATRVEKFAETMPAHEDTPKAPGVDVETTQRFGVAVEGSPLPLFRPVVPTRLIVTIGEAPPLKVGSTS
jgi:hypothetical protein